MFTGIVQAVATVAAVTDRPGLRSFMLSFPPGFLADQTVGASVACDGVCLTVTRHESQDRAEFDVMQQSLALMTEQASVIKRPVVQWPDGSLTVGFDESAWSKRW